jgi:hypothetical protein
MTSSDIDATDEEKMVLEAVMHKIHACLKVNPYYAKASCLLAKLALRSSPPQPEKAIEILCKLLSFDIV